MKSIFHSERTVTVDGTEYRIEADTTIEGVPFFEVTNLETDEFDTCGRRGATAVIDDGMAVTPFPEAMREVLKRTEEIEGVTVRKAGGELEEL